MESVLIVTNDAALRKKLYSLNWDALGYSICPDATGKDRALAIIAEQTPTLVFLDCTLPHSGALEILERARAAGFMGGFALVGGRADTRLVQGAMKHGVSRYYPSLTPVTELEDDLHALCEQLRTYQALIKNGPGIMKLAKSEQLRLLVRSMSVPNSELIDKLSLSSDCYCVAVYEYLGADSGAADFSALLAAADIFDVRFDSFTENSREIILLRDSRSIKSLVSLASNELQHELPENLSFFIAIGSRVASPSSICMSYSQAIHTAQRRYLSPAGVRVVLYDRYSAGDRTEALTGQFFTTYTATLISVIQIFNRRKVSEALETLEEHLYRCNASVEDIRLYLIDMMIEIAENFRRNFKALNIPIAANSQIITDILHHTFLHETMLFFSKQFELIMSSIGNTSRESVLIDVDFYIQHNYDKPIRLETIAQLFGYNSAYLGKIFSRAHGMSFNSYLDSVRVKNAMTLLRETDMKVYEIARQVGYKSVDYFHKKFRSATGESPAEYRKRVQGNE